MYQKKINIYLVDRSKSIFKLMICIPIDIHIAENEICTDENRTQYGVHMVYLHRTKEQQMTVVRTVVTTSLKPILKITLEGLTAAMPMTKDTEMNSDLLASLTTQGSIDIGIPDRAPTFYLARCFTI